LRRRVLVAGLGITVVSGQVLGRAALTHSGGLWWIGGLLLLVGAVVVLCELARERAATGHEGKPRPTPQVHFGAPLLGRMLVEHYGFVTESELAAALIEQRGTRRRIGQILLRRGAVTVEQLEEALGKQRSLLFPDVE